MSSRERWTVYPLLFLAIGLAIRASAVPPERFEAAKVDSLEVTRLVCREIVVEADDGTVLIHMGRVVGKGGGRIEIKDAAGGGSAGVAGLAGSAMNAASGPGGKAVEQVTRAVKFCESARAMIESQSEYIRLADAAAQANIRKAQS